jgi:hypothetical protein
VQIRLWRQRPIPRSIPIAARSNARRPRSHRTKIASELERSADRARERGGFAAAAAFLERSAALTPDPAHRVRRELTAAQANHEAGLPEAALKLPAAAEAGPLDELQRARLRAQLAFALRRGSDAPPLLLATAKTP